MISYVQKKRSAEYFIQQASRFVRRRELELCLRSSDEAIRLGADPLSVAHDRWMCFMLRGEFERAWQETDLTEAARLRSAECQDELPLHLRRVWDGSRLEGRTVVVHCYHGLGDTIQFARYLPVLREQASRVILECQPSLIPLLKSVDGIDQFYALGDCPPCGAGAVEIEIMELPYAFRTTLETIPREVRYLHVPSPETRGKWRQEYPHSFRVGIACRSGDWNCSRDFPRGELHDIRSLPSIKLFNLDRCEAEIGDSLYSEFGMINTEEPCGTIVDTAATILEMDLVVSVDTMIAHLAGALGKPVWLLLPFCADWRWMMHRNDSPWYPTMRIFRQPSAGDWNSVSSSLHEAMRETSADGRLDAGFSA